MPRQNELADVDCLLRFYTASGKAVAIAIDEDHLTNPPIFLPLSEVEIWETDRMEAGCKIATITMPQWLAEEKGLV